MKRRQRTRRMYKIPRRLEIMRARLRKPLSISRPLHPVHRHLRDESAAAGVGDDGHDIFVLLVADQVEGDGLFGRRSGCELVLKNGEGEKEDVRCGAIERLCSGTCTVHRGT